MRNNILDLKALMRGRKIDRNPASSGSISGNSKDGVPKILMFGDNQNRKLRLEWLYVIVYATEGRKEFGGAQIPT